MVVFVTRALLLGVYIRAPDFWKQMPPSAKISEKRYPKQWQRSEQAGKRVLDPRAAGR